MHLSLTLTQLSPKELYWTNIGAALFKVRQKLKLCKKLAIMGALNPKKNLFWFVVCCFASPFCDTAVTYRQGSSSINEIHSKET